FSSASLTILLFYRLPFLVIHATKPNQVRNADLSVLQLEANCCFIKIAALVASPQARSHSADLLITASAITSEFAPTLIRLYEQMSAPKFVITLGACNATSNSTIQEVNALIPVNVHLAECPLRSQTILNAIAQLRRYS
ncbi:MAG: hypothetical protein C4288_20135, partial [Leptolyngbya sp. ERB_1_1]